jgi:hypothetical protein
MLPDRHLCRIDPVLRDEWTLESTDKMRAMEEHARGLGRPPPLPLCPSPAPPPHHPCPRTDFSGPPSHISALPQAQPLHDLRAAQLSRAALSAVPTRTRAALSPRAAVFPKRTTLTLLDPCPQTCRRPSASSRAWASSARPPGPLRDVRRSQSTTGAPREGELCRASCAVTRRRGVAGQWLPSAFPHRSALCAVPSRRGAGMHARRRDGRRHASVPLGAKHERDFTRRCGGCGTCPRLAVQRGGERVRFSHPLLPVTALRPEAPRAAL